MSAANGSRASLGATLLAAAVMALASGQAWAQGAPEAPQQAPAAPGAPAVPNNIPDIRGPDGVFTLLPDQASWAKFQTVRAIGVKCTDKACGGDRVFCMIQTRADTEAKPGVALPDAVTKTFGDGVISSAPKELKAEFVVPFEPKTLGANVGHWAEVKAEGEPGSLRFGLFLVAAKGYDVAFNCVAPGDRWDAHKAKFETLLSALKIEP